MIDITFPMKNTVIAISNSFRRSTFDVIAIKTGAPIAKTKEKIETNWPTIPTDTLKSPAIIANKPVIMNSTVPATNVAIAKI